MVEGGDHNDIEPQMVRADSNVREQLAHKHEYQQKDYVEEEAISYDKEHDEELDDSPIEEVAAVVPKYVDTSCQICISVFSNP